MGSRLEKPVSDTKWAALTLAYLNKLPGGYFPGIRTFHLSFVQISFVVPKGFQSQHSAAVMVLMKSFRAENICVFHLRRW
jgi:hypothetical protein